ncbi:MAG: DEAD/DEAH box helicase [Prevotella sp.]
MNGCPDPSPAATADALYRRMAYMADAAHASPGTVGRQLHALLAEVCHEGVKDTEMAFGNLFAQTAYLCRRHGLGRADTLAIQRMRRRSNHAEREAEAGWRYDLRALATLTAAVTGCGVPDYLLQRLPSDNPLAESTPHIDCRCLRCMVRGRPVGALLHAEADAEGGCRQIEVDLTGHEYLLPLLHEGMQLNLIDCAVGDRVVPRMVVVEPDYLVDISAVARCFTDYGHHPLAYTVGKMEGAALSQAILLGNFAGRALDDIIYRGEDYDWRDTLWSSFRERALEYCSCQDLNEREDFKTAARRQTDNLQHIVRALFDAKAPRGSLSPKAYDRAKAILEPTFVCEQLGLLGRIDLMTTDMRLLVEQKSGSNYHIQSGRPGAHGSLQKEDHYVQLLLYAGVLERNFPHLRGRSDIYLIYSKYPLPGGLVAMNRYGALLHEALRLRNRIVATDYDIARHGFGTVAGRLHPDVLLEHEAARPFYLRYIRPRLEETLKPLHTGDEVAHAYLMCMLTMVYREHLAAKVGSHEGQAACMANLWNMPTAMKRETGNLYVGLRIADKAKSRPQGGYDLITLHVPDQGEDFLPNFRQGDMIYLYAYEGEPDVRRAILYRGSLADIRSGRLVVHLNDGQQNADIITDGCYAVEHAGSDAMHTAAIRSLCALMRAPSSCRELLLAQRTPTADTRLTLSRSYHPHYDDIVLQAKQAQDYYLLVGPPGTGKTSMALRFMVQETLAEADTSVLLTAYTNRAVDEICGMLETAAIDYLRIGNEYVCDPRFRHRLLEQQVGDRPRLDTVRGLIAATRVVVATTATLLGKMHLFGIKRFDVAIVDEASQLLEPNIVGLLAQVRKFVLIGDHKQLPAVVQQSASLSAVTDPVLHGIGLRDCRDSLFERLYRHEQAMGRRQFTGILRRQGRMHPDIARFPNRMFYSKEQLQCVPLPHQTEEAIYPTTAAPSDALGRLMLRQRMLFVPSSADGIPASASDKTHAVEADIVAGILQRVYDYYGKDFDADRTVGVIVPYRNQIAMIRKRIERLGIAALEGVSIDTVERYQGSQRDVIVYSFTIRHTYQLDFLTANSLVEGGKVIDRKLNVAITRARKQLIMTGDEETLRHNATFAELIDDVIRHGGYWCGV